MNEIHKVFALLKETGTLPPQQSETTTHTANIMLHPTDYYTQLLGNYKTLNSEKYGITRIGIFGSVARGEHTEDSDIDVCVELCRPDAFALVHIKDDLEALFHKSVDLVRLRSRMNPLLRQNIEHDSLYA